MNNPVDNTHRPDHRLDNRGGDLVKEIHVLDVKTKHKTHLIFKKMELNTGIEDAQFHEMHLKRLP